MQTPLPLTQEIVLIGGGHAHALLLRRWGMSPLPGARLTLINPTATAPYTGMLPGFVAGHYSRDALEIDLVRLARFAGARMIFGKVTAIDRVTRRLTVEGRGRVAYDVASLDIGITSDMPDLPGFITHGIAAKPLGPFAARWTAHLAGDRGPVAVIGGGVAGVELALAMRHALGDEAAVSVIEAGTALQGIGAATAARLRDEMRRAGIQLFEGIRVAEVSASSIRLEDGRECPATLTVGAAGARPFGWLEDTGLTLENGYVAVDQTLRSINDPAIFAVGDCAYLTHAPRPKAGVFAVRAAPVLTHNLRAAAMRDPMKSFRPQTQYLKLISLGRKAALADKYGLAIGGDWAWRWKDRIDRAFMEKLDRPPRMKPPPLPVRRAVGMAEAQGPKPLCGGCGAKLGSGMLDRVLASLPPLRADVSTGAGDDAAVLTMGDTRQVLTTDHLRAFWDDPWLMARITAIHALGDVWAMGASPQAALMQITLPRLAAHMQEAWLTEIMAAAAEVIEAEGASIVGGHSTIGAELQLGITLTGLANGAVVTMAGAKSGDVLLLTRPIGSGTLLAAEMEYRADGDHVQAALQVMATPQGDAARLLASLAHAMTDVTGFGLAGHAARMAQASGLSAHIDLAALPIYAGAEALAEAGVRSSIWRANRDAVLADVPDTARSVLLFDPQTAGGLLASLPEKQAKMVVNKLKDLGHTAEIIGKIEDRGDAILTAS